MNTRVTLTRVIQQYADINIGGVESEDEARERVEEILSNKAARARVLQDVKWFGADVVEDVCVEHVQLDEGKK